MCVSVHRASCDCLAGRWQHKGHWEAGACLRYLLQFLHTDDPRQFHGLKEVKKAARKAKAFEIRKIVKRLKASGFVHLLVSRIYSHVVGRVLLGETNADESTLDAELKALKVWLYCSRVVYR